MPELSAISQWVEQYPSTGWILLLVYIVFGMVRQRVINAEPGAVIRGLLNFRKRQLEQILTQPYMNEQDFMLVKRELRYRSLYQLTGFFNYRLQDLIVIMCDRYGLRAGYLKPWHNWIKERDGQIIFNRKWYCFWWYCFLIGQVVNLALVVLIASYIFSHFSIRSQIPLLVIFMLIWWLPILVFTSVPPPGQTREMESYLEKFNGGNSTVE